MNQIYAYPAFEFPEKYNLFVFSYEILMFGKKLEFGWKSSEENEKVDLLIEQLSDSDPKCSTVNYIFCFWFTWLFG